MISQFARTLAVPLVLVTLTIASGCAGPEKDPPRADPPMPVQKQTKSFGIPWENEFGYVQGVKAGPTIHVAGQFSVDGQGALVGTGSMDAQLRQAYVNVRKVLDQFNAKMEDVVEETIYVTDMKEAVAAASKVRREVYSEHPAVASTLVQVQQLPIQGALVAVAVTATTQQIRSTPSRQDRGGSSGGRGGGRGGMGGMGGGFPRY
jgi:2-iminobutanoate/2-iminopropanoate deaminase